MRAAARTCAGAVMLFGLLPRPDAMADQAAQAARAHETAADPRVATLKAAGTACYRKRDYVCALKRFEAAFALAPTPQMRFNVASAQDKLGLHTLAVRQYRVYLKEAAVGAPTRVLGHIRRRLELLLQRVGRIRIVLAAPTPARATVFLNGAPVDPTWSRVAVDTHELVVDAGTHRVMVTSVGYRPRSDTLSVKAGEMARLSVSLSALPPPQSSPELPAPARPSAHVSSPVSGAIRSRSSDVEVAARSATRGQRSATTRVRKMARPIALYDLPVVGPVLGDRAGATFDLASSDVTVYRLGIDAGLLLFDRLQLAFNLPLLMHGVFYGSEGPGVEETHLGNLEVRLAARFLGEPAGPLTGVAYLNARLPTTSWDLPSREAFNFRPGAVMGLQRGIVTLAGDLAVQVAVRDGIDRTPVTLLFNAFTAARPHPLVSLQLSAQLAVLLDPAIDQPGIALLPAVAAHPFERFRIAIGTRVALTEAGKLFNLGVRTMFAMSSGYEF